MRDAFFVALVEAAAADDRIELMIGDVGFRVVDDFARRFPDRFHNAGVAEQNMTSVATGLALSGSMVFTYSIANFPTLRCLEQIRNDVCHHHANVKIVAVGGGMAYGPLGPSHHATEDLAIMRAMPGLVVAAPGDAAEATTVVRSLASFDGPAYLRLGRSGGPLVHASPPSIPIGKALTLAEGNDICLLSTGGLLAAALEVSHELAKDRLSVRVISVPWIKPLDIDVVHRAAIECQLVVTIEEHSIAGGFGGAVAEEVAQLRSHAPLHRIGLPAEPTREVGSHDYLRRIHGLDTAGIVNTVRAAWKEARGLARPLR